VEAKGEPVERERFLKAHWPDVTVEEASVNQLISQLRKSLNGTSETGLIQTVPRRRYRLRVRPRALGSTETVPVRTELGRLGNEKAFFWPISWSGKPNFAEVDSSHALLNDAWHVSQLPTRRHNRAEEVNLENQV
jgi:hypothetical protein